MLTAAERHPASLPIATASAGRTDLLAIPPDTGDRAAGAAMEQAAQAGNRTRAPALLAATTGPGGPPASTPAGTAPDNAQLSTWDWEGGPAAQT